MTSDATNQYPDFPGTPTFILNGTMLEKTRDGSRWSPRCKAARRARLADAAGERLRIRRLKLSGFKSFVEPAELRIEPGLTGVVGPNGCGKSNLLEAIRWAMGESSPKSLRGGGMDDVIFAGTATRPPRDFAEVSILLERDASERGRRAAKAKSPGGSSAAPDRPTGSMAATSAQKDVSLLFADAATGAHSPALVSQGKIGAVIAAKPVERRLLLEEAAGISGLHARRKDAEQKLRATEANLARLGEILGDQEQRAAQLRRQARAAERYRKLSDQIRSVEARLLYARWLEAERAADTANADAKAAAEEVDGNPGGDRRGPGGAGPRQRRAHRLPQCPRPGCASMATSWPISSRRRGRGATPSPAGWPNSTGSTPRSRPTSRARKRSRATPPQAIAGLDQERGEIELRLEDSEARSRRGSPPSSPASRPLARGRSVARRTACAASRDARRAPGCRGRARRGESATRAHRAGECTPSPSNSRRSATAASKWARATSEAKAKAATAALAAAEARRVEAEQGRTRRPSNAMPPRARLRPRAPRCRRRSPSMTRWPGHSNMPAARRSRA